MEVREDLRSGSASCSALWPDVVDLLPESVTRAVAAAAPAGDRTGQIDPQVLELLRECGYFGLPVPTEMQGGGAGILACCAVQHRLASADAALAIALNMHLFSLGVMVEHWLRHRDSSWLLLEAVATQHRIVASGFAEPGLAGSILRSRSTAVAVEGGGYRIDGVKAPCSLASRSDLVCFQVQEPGFPGQLLTCLVPTDAPGIRVERTWDWIGMRASESDTLVFEDCTIPDDLVFHRCEPGRDDDGIFGAGLVWFCLTTAASYLGLLDAAIESAVESMDGQKVAHLDRPRSQVAAYQGALGTVVAGVLEATAAVVGLATAMDARTCAPESLLPAALAVKHRVAELAGTGVDVLAELMGAGSLRNGLPLERYVRDVQAARFHPPTPLVTAHILGRWRLTGDLRVELADNGQWEGNTS